MGPDRRRLADKLNNPSKGVSGICLRGLTGWGDNLAALDTVVNTFGGQWFDTSWNAHLTDPAFEAATNFYVNLVKKDGEKGAGQDSFNECLNLMEQSKTAMWYDATVAAATIDATGSPIVGNVGFAPAPVEQDQGVGLVVELGARTRRCVEEQGSRVDVHGLGDVEELHRLRRGAERLGGCSSRNAHLDLPEPELPGGGE